MSRKKLIIVESPTKARTIKKFLTSDYEVESCMGHLRDLPESAKDIPEKYKKYKWARLGVNVEKNFEPIYLIPKSKHKTLSLLKSKAKNAKEIILAADEDREGESISWHLQEILDCPKTSFKRMVFHEITKETILESLKKFRPINKNLVYAQEARRILDRLVGYSLSPVLWKRVARGLSAGRVQSVAVRLLSEREFKRIHFKKSQYWSLSAQLLKGKIEFSAGLSSYAGKDLAGSGDFDRETGEFIKPKKLLLDEKKAKALEKELRVLDFKVSEVKSQSVSKKPSPPFTTSTLQQEANRKLSLSSKETMSLAQQLYERGFITYMRTDSVFLSKQAVSASRKAIQKHYGKEYVPQTQRVYQNKSKGAQEAHEAIRPAGSSFAHPTSARLQGRLLQLYQMIWRRTLASQMPDCRQKRVSAIISAGKKAQFSAHGMTIEFPGFYKVYEGVLNPEENRLPALKSGETLKCQGLQSQSHETKPLPRFTEASLVQTLEKEGIGRPSTYAPIIATIQKRGYVFKDKNTLAPTMTGLIVTQFLKDHFPDYVNIGFTSDMEQVLDDIAVGKKNHIQYLKDMYSGKKGLKQQTESFDKKEFNPKDRSLEIPGLEGFVFCAGPYGAYVMSQQENSVSASLPDQVYPGHLTKQHLADLLEKKKEGHDSVGKDPESGQPIYVLVGKYGPYVQRGQMEESSSGSKKDKKEKPKRVSIPRGLDTEDVDLKTALKLLELPKTLGKHPETSQEVKQGIGRFGPYIVHDGDFRSIRSIDDFFNMTLKQALSILAEPKKGKKKVLKKFDSHPETGQSIQLLDGKYGAYLQHGKQKVTVPKEVSISSLTQTKVLKLLGGRLKQSVSKTRPTARKAASPDKANGSLARKPRKLKSAPKSGKFSMAGLKKNRKSFKPLSKTVS